jgi:transcriptional regulator with XRE-family HTH domain
VRLMNHEIYAGFAKRLKQLCDDKNLPERGRQAALARLCGIKPSSVNKWFSAISLPDPANLLTIADWGRTTVDWLLDGRLPKEPSVQTETQRYALGWMNSEEEEVLTEYRQCTPASKALVRDMLKQAEKDKTALRIAS